jgi:hypothetical protein
MHPLRITPVGIFLWYLFSNLDLSLANTVVILTHLIDIIGCIRMLWSEMLITNNF